MQLVNVVFVELELDRRGRDLGVCEHPDQLPAGDQTPDLFELLKIR